MSEEVKTVLLDPSINVKTMIAESIERLDDLRKVEVKRIDERIDASDDKYQVQFNSAKDAVSIALIAQEKAVAAALEGTKEAINKADITTDKRFDLLSEKIDAIANTMSKNTGAQGIYVTHDDLTTSIEKLQDYMEHTLQPVVAFMNSQQGKQGIFDPQITLLISEMKATRESAANGAGQKQGIGSSWLVVVGAVGLIGAIAAVIMNAVTLATRVPLK